MLHFASPSLPDVPNFFFVLLVTSQVSPSGGGKGKTSEGGGEAYAQLIPDRLEAATTGADKPAERATERRR